MHHHSKSMGRIEIKKKALDELDFLKGFHQSDIIKESTVFALHDANGEEIGFSIVLVLGSRFLYPNECFDDWKNRFEAEGYEVYIENCKLHVRYRVMY